MTDSEHLQDEKVVELLKALGRAYLENGEHDKAVEKFRQLTNTNSEDADLWLNYAFALAETEAISEDALQAYGKAASFLPDDEKLHLTLASLFLKKEITTGPALRVYRRTLGFQPESESQIREAMGKIFQETTETITIPEIRETLLDCIDNPDLLSLFLTTAWRDKKFAETLEILRDLYMTSNKNELYLKALYHTLLENKSSSEETGQYFVLAPTYAQYCLKYHNSEAPLSRIVQMEGHLDFKNLFLALRKNQDQQVVKDDEYEFFLLDKSIEQIDEVTESINLPVHIQPTFSLVADLLGKVQKNNGAADMEIVQPETGANTVAIFEITNYDSKPELSKLPFETFLKLISAELASKPGVTMCTTSDGIIALGANPGKMLTDATEILQKLERYNTVVEDFERIELTITLHCSPIPFRDLEHEGIREIRKAFKIHNLDEIAEQQNGKAPVSNSQICTSDELANQVSNPGLVELGQFKFPFFPAEHLVHQLQNGAPGPAATKTGPSKQYGKYEIQETLKESALGSTFRGYDPQLERPVIVKSFNTTALAGAHQFASLKKHFYEEIRQFNRINHPNIGVIYDAGEQADNLYLVREFIEGTALSSHLNGQTNAPVDFIVELFTRICKLLEHFHQTEVWHRNLRPDNIFLVAHNDIKIVDGSVLPLWSNDDIRVNEIEILSYASPEQIQKAKLDETCDIFQLGTMLYESLTGTNPFRADSPATVRMRVLVDHPKPPTFLNKSLPKAVDAILVKALSKDPENRHRTVKELESELKELIPGRETSTKGRTFEIIK